MQTPVSSHDGNGAVPDSRQRFWRKSPIPATPPPDKPDTISHQQSHINKRHQPFLPRHSVHITTFEAINHTHHV